MGAAKQSLPCKFQMWGSRLSHCRVSAPSCAAPAAAGWWALGAQAPQRRQRRQGSSSKSGGHGGGRRALVSRSSAYDDPALYTNEESFSEESYWSRRFRDEPLGYEWYRGWESLAPVITRHLPRAARVLQVGVGTSSLQADMALAGGYSSILSVDYSPVAIARLEAARLAAPEGSPLREALAFEVADMRRGLAEKLGEGAFGGVLDKGALDALLCGDDGVADAHAAVGEIWRVLAPGACYVMVTSASPRVRLPVLQGAGVEWARVLVHEVGQQGAHEGPFDAASEEAQATLPRLGYSHFVYAAYKP